MYRTSIFNPEDKLSELRKENEEEIYKITIVKKIERKFITVKVYKNIKTFKGLLCLNDILFEEDEYLGYTIFTIYDET